MCAVLLPPGVNPIAVNKYEAYHILAPALLIRTPAMFHKSMYICGAVARCASYDAHLATAPQHIPTQHYYSATTPRFQIRIEL